jgi:import inner membrane translocase subunit TIM8
MEQQKAQLQEMISNLAALAWEKCISYPGRSLSSSEAACVQNCVGRYFDTGEYMLQRFKHKAAKAQGGGGISDGF